MLRCTIEILPQGDEGRARPLGVVEIANVGGSQEVGDYYVVLKKTPPFSGALKATWKSGRIPGHEDSDVIVGKVDGHHRQKRGVYDLLFRALAATVGDRNKQADSDKERGMIEFAVRSGHEALLESLRNGKVWPTITEALKAAGLEIVPSQRKSA